MMVSVGTVPGTDFIRLAQRLADAVVDLPVPAAVMLGTLDIPEDILDIARELGERQGMLADLTADVELFAARLWFRPSPDLPATADEVGSPSASTSGKRSSDQASGLERGRHGRRPKVFDDDMLTFALALWAKAVTSADPPERRLLAGQSRVINW